MVARRTVAGLCVLREQAICRICAVCSDGRASSGVGPRRNQRCTLLVAGWLVVGVGAGGPQVYRIGTNAGDRPKRITFTGNYNARPRLSADGNLLAVVTQDSGNYRVAVQDLNSGTFREHSKGQQVESPSFVFFGCF